MCFISADVFRRRIPAEGDKAARQPEDLERLWTFLNEDLTSKGSLPMEKMTRQGVHPSVEGRPNPTHTAECTTR